VESAHYAAFSCQGVVDLHDVLASVKLLQLFLAEQSLKITPAISDRGALN
jgi:hypothetical protein